MGVSGSGVSFIPGTGSGGGGSGSSYTKQVITNGGPVSMAATDTYIEINNAVPAVTTVNGNANPPVGVPIIIADGGFNSSQFPITFVPANGQANFILRNNGGALTLIYNGSLYRLVA